MPDTPHLETASQVLTALLRALGEALPFVVLRNYEGLPEIWGNDVDILIRPADLAEVKKITAAFLISSPYADRVFKMERHNFWSVSLSCVDRELQVDFYTAMSKAWFTYADTEVIFAARRSGHALFFVPDTLHELLLIAAKELFAYGYIRSRYHERLAGHQKKESIESAKQLFIRYLTPQGCSLIAHALIDPTVTGRPGVRLGNLLNPIALCTWLYLRKNNRQKW